MMGKILGIASVAVTQVAIWGVLICGLSATVLPALMPADLMQTMEAIEAGQMTAMEADMDADMLSALLYLVRGDKALAKATVEAYRDFMALHGALNKKRYAVRSSRKAESKKIYRGSIVLRYALGKRFFGDMMK